MPISCYQHDVEHGSARNAELLIRAVEAAKASGCPSIIGLDAQEEPADFLKWAAPITNRGNGNIASPDQAISASCSRKRALFSSPTSAP